jgi:prefoldin subunit 5
VRFAETDEGRFARMLKEKMEIDESRSVEALGARLATMQKRDEELDVLIKRIYEDNALGKISDTRMAKLMGDYEDEQAKLESQIEVLQQQIHDLSEKEVSIEEFIELVRKHSDIKRLNKALLNRFVDKIVIHQAVRAEGRYKQDIEIYYNCVGTIAIPDTEDCPAAKVSMTTRKGVVLNYSPALQSIS